MGVKIKNLEAAAKHQLEVNAPITAMVRDSIAMRDTTAVLVKSVSMITPHIQLSGIIEKDSLIGSIQFCPLPCDKRCGSNINGVGCFGKRSWRCIKSSPVKTRTWKSNIQNIS